MNLKWLKITQIFILPWFYSSPWSCQRQSLMHEAHTQTHTHTLHSSCDFANLWWRSPFPGSCADSAEGLPSSNFCSWWDQGQTKGVRESPPCPPPSTAGNLHTGAAVSSWDVRMCVQIWQKATWRKFINATLKQKWRTNEGKLYN